MEVHLILHHHGEDHLEMRVIHVRVPRDPGSLTTSTGCLKEVNDTVYALSGLWSTIPGIGSDDRHEMLFTIQRRGALVKLVPLLQW